MSTQLESEPCKTKTLNDQLFHEIKEKIERYFTRNKIKRTGNVSLYLKGAFFLSMTMALYFTMLFCPLPLWALAIVSGALGISFAGIGFNIMHDSGHGSFSSNKWLNILGGYTLNLMGGNIFLWKNKHNVNHHNYTNIKGMDEDIDIEPFIRTHASQPRHWYHRYQHIYSAFLYGIVHLNWVLYSDFRKYFLRKVSETEMKKIPIKEHIIFWASKAVHFSLFLVLPMVMLGVWKALFMYFVVSFVCGVILGTTFQLAHVVQNVEFPKLTDVRTKTKNNWALYQIKTTVNFATKNRFVFWFTGGLNFQLVHHLFPKISHVHFPVINKLIRETCAKFDIRYMEYPTCWSALRSHFSYLKCMGVS
ncbi:MAG: acyl-CoA desaturase [Chlamydiales bacterium]|nr:acyl-CoA desaturase [Chlamydiales bacterium]